jgi:hypothetical protein
MVCTGMAGALHGLNEMGRSPFLLISFPCLGSASKEKHAGLESSLHLKRHILKNRLPLHFENHSVAGF